MLTQSRRASVPNDRFLKTSRKSRDTVNVVDVYDSAAAIGKDFEMLIDRYGTECVQNIMPKVISVLEDLETLASKNEEEVAIISNLQMAVSRLESEKLARAQERSRFECEHQSYLKELEQIEETWRSESQSMLEMIEKLREENHRLMTDLENAQNSQPAQATVEPTKPALSDDQMKLMTQMKETIDNQRDQIRALKRDVQQKAVDVDALQQQSDALAKLNAELRRRDNLVQRQQSHLLDEKSTLEADLQSKEQLIREMRGLVHTESQSSESESSPRSPAQELQNETVASLEAEWEEVESPVFRDQNNATVTFRNSDAHSLAETLAIAGGTTFSEDEFVEKLNLEGKMIIDTKDPQRPRFTMSELREVLRERNELKTKLIEVEEELNVFRNSGDCEAPVQGPINREPDEKLRPQRNPQEYGIKLFFSRLFSRSSSSRRSSSVCSSKRRPSYAAEMSYPF